VIGLISHPPTNNLLSTSYSESESI